MQDPLDPVAKPSDESIAFAAADQEGILRVISAVQKTHIAHFYDTRQDLIDILVPFFKEGLAKGEFCLWGADDPLPPAEAELALRDAVPDLDRYIEARQIHIFPVKELYGSRFEPGAVFEDFIKTIDDAVQRGFSGFRCDGNTGSVPARDWVNFQLYEREVQAAVPKFSITAMCSYPIHRCTTEDMKNVLHSHHGSLRKRGGAWEYSAGWLGREKRGR